MALALAGMLGPEQDYIKGSTPTDNAIIEGKKTTLALGDLAAKQKAQDYVNGNLKDLYSQAKRNDLSAEGAVALMQYSPDLYNHMATLQKDASEQALKRDKQLKDFIAGGIAHVNASPDKVQGWNDFRMAAKANGVPLGAFDAEYSPQLYEAAKMSVAGLDALKTGPIVQKDGIIYQDTPEGQKFLAREPDAKKMKADWKMKVDENGNPVTKQADVGGRTQTFAVEVDDQGNERISTKPLGLSAPPRAAPRQAAPKLVQTVDDQGNLQWESVPAGQVPKGKPIAKAPQMTEDENKAAGWVVQAGNALDNMKRVLASNPNADKPGFFETISPELLANQLRSAPRQMFVQAASSFSEAALRAATGAGVNIQEAKQKIAELTPVYGDKPEVIQQKLASIPLYLESLKARAGRALPKAESALATRTQKPGAPAQIKSAADYNALPSGSIFIDPQGVKRRKP